MLLPLFRDNFIYCCFKSIIMSLDNLIVNGMYELSKGERYELNHNYDKPTEETEEIALNILDKVDGLSNMDVIDIKVITKTLIHIFQEPIHRFSESDLEKIFGFHLDGAEKEEVEDNSFKYNSRMHMYAHASSLAYVRYLKDPKSSMSWLKHSYETIKCAIEMDDKLYDLGILEGGQNKKNPYYSVKINNELLIILEEKRRRTSLSPKLIKSNISESIVTCQNILNYIDLQEQSNGLNPRIYFEGKIAKLKEERKDRKKHHRKPN